MENARKFIDKLRHGQTCIGTSVSCTDPTITEALCGLSDFIWIDAEHGPLSLERIQGHLMATKGSGAAALVRVPWNDPVLIKPVLDIGADGVIVPLVRHAEDVRRAVAACRYPPDGIRGYGPRRPSQYGRLSGPEFCRLANASIIIVAQIEHSDALENLDEILAVPGLTSVLVGPNDLAGSMGLMGQPEHPRVLSAMETVVARARAAGVFASVAIGGGPEAFSAWVQRGVSWISVGGDIGFMLSAARHLVARVRAAVPPAGD